MPISTLKALTLALGLFAGGGAAIAQTAPAKFPPAEIADDALVRLLPGFERATAEVNGTQLHYVAGGKGKPVLLLPGWPQTWWSYHKVMPELAKRYCVIAVDLRGMGGSAKPASGYDKKTMARDIHELVRALGYDKADIVGHDIGAHVAFAYAANYPAATRTLTLLDVPHPDAQLATWPLLPKAGTFGDKIDEKHAFAWWFAFHQVKGLPEDLLEGRAHIEHEWFYRYLAYDEGAIDAKSRAVYAAAYATRDAIRAGNAWYQAFPQDILDDNGYARLTMPVLGLAGPGYEWLKGNLEENATKPLVIKIEGSGHFIPEERPQAMLRHLTTFLDEAP